MEVKLNSANGTVNIEIKLANNRSLFLSPQSAERLAYDILDTLKNLNETLHNKIPQIIETYAAKELFCSIAPPDYLDKKVAAAIRNGPGAILLDGTWRGSATSRYTVFDIRIGKEDCFKVQLPVPDDDADPVVMLVSKKQTFPVYDLSQHSKSDNEITSKTVNEAVLQDFLRCPRCGKQLFQVSVGFEIAEDYQETNDMTWFALAVKCQKCDWVDLVYSDETA